jgi:hypothetical protein
VNARDLALLERGGPEALAREAERQRAQRDRAAEQRRKAKAARKTRSPRAAGATKADRDAAAAAEWMRVKAAVRARSGGRCEVVRPGMPRCPRAAVDCDHFWQGANKRIRQSVESCWDVCREDHDLRQANTPTRLFWVDVFEVHVLTSGLRTQVPFIVAERARLEGKRR